MTEFGQCFAQKSLPHPLQCHCFPTLPLARPKKPTDIDLRNVEILDTLIDLQVGTG